MKLAAKTVLVLLLMPCGLLSAQEILDQEPPLPEGAVARLGTLKLRHSGDAYSVDFSPDGKTVAATSQHGEAFIWSVETGRRLRVLRPAGGPADLLALAYSPDGRTIAVDTFGEEILLFDPATGNQTGSWRIEDKHNSQRGSLAWSPDGKSFAVAIESNFAVLDTASGKVSFLHESRSEIQDFAFSPDGKRLAVGTITPGAQIWDLNTKKVLHEFDAQEISGCVAYSPDGNWLATGAGEIIIWNTETGKEEFRLEGDDPLFMDLAFTPDGKSLVAGSQEGSVYEWDFKSRKQTRKLDSKMFTLRSIALSRDGTRIAASFAANTIRLWDRKSGKMLFADEPGHTDVVKSVAFSPDSRTLCTGTLWDVAAIQFWESPSGRHEKAVVSDHMVSQAAFSPNGNLLATAWMWNENIQLWDAKTKNELRKLNVGDIRVSGLAFDSKGKELVAFSMPKVRGSASLSRFRVETGELVKTVKHQGPYFGNFFALSPDGEWAVLGKWNETAQMNDLEVWNARTGKIAGLFSDVSGYVQSLQFAGDGDYLVAGNYDKTVTVWEMSSGKKVLSLTGHKRPLSRIAVSPDGRTIASGSASEYPLPSSERHRIRYWDVFTGKELAYHVGHDENVTSLAFSPDGTYLASGLRDTTTLVWKVPETIVNQNKDVMSLSDAELNQAWKSLLSDDAEKAYRAMAVLSLGDDDTVNFFNDRLKPIAAADEKIVKGLLEKLNDEEFQVREEAHKELIALGGSAGKLVRDFGEKAVSAETKWRCGVVLEQLERPFITDKTQLRNVRAIKILGRINSTEAQILLKKLSEGTPSARETQEASRLLQAFSNRKLEQ